MVTTDSAVSAVAADTAVTAMTAEGAVTAVKADSAVTAMCTLAGLPEAVQSWSGNNMIERRRHE